MENPLIRLASDLSNPEVILDTPNLSRKSRVALIKDDVVAQSVASILFSSVQTEDFQSIDDLSFEQEEDLDRSLTDYPNIRANIDQTMEQYRFRKLILVYAEDLINGDRSVLTGLFESTFQDDPLRFLRIIKNFGQLDWYDLFQDYIEGKQPKAADLLLPLELQRIIFDEAIKVVQANSDSKEDLDNWVKAMKQRGGYQSVSDITTQKLDLNAGGLPKISKQTQLYEAFIKQFLEEAEEYGGFGLLTELFEQKLTDLFGDDFKFYYTHGTYLAFKSTASRFIAHNPKAKVYVTPEVYLPMYYHLPEANREMTDCLEDTDIINKLAKEAEQTDEPIVLLISSQPRNGNKKHDINYLADQIDAINEAQGTKQIHLWVDASQDNNIHNNGDITWYSKRFTATGGGLANMKEETYPRDEMDLQEAVAIRAGFQIEMIARNIAAAHSISTRFTHLIENLFDTPTFWYFQGKGRYLALETEAMLQAFTDEGLDDHFEYLGAAPEDLYSTDSRYITANLALFRPKDASQYEEIIQNLAGVKHTSFNLRKTAQDNTDYINLEALINEEDFDRTKFIRLLSSLEEYYRDWIIHAPTSIIQRIESGELETDQEIRDAYNQVMDLNVGLRIQLGNLHKPGTGVEFIRRLKEATSLALSF